MSNTKNTDNPNCKQANADSDRQDTVQVSATPPGTDPKVRGRRALFLTGMASAVGALAAACGNSKFSSSAVPPRKPKAAPSAVPSPGNSSNGEQLSGSGGGEDGAEGEEIPAGGGGTPVPGGTAAPIAACVPGETLTLDQPESAQLIKKFALYGKADSALLALHIGGLKVGDVVMICKKSGTTGQALMSKRVASIDLDLAVAVRPMIFDNLRLVGLTSVDVLVVSGTTKRRATVPCAEANFKRSFDDGTGSARVVDIFEQHPNFHSMMPHMVFANPQGAMSTAQMQRPVARPMKLAQDSSSWDISAITTQFATTTKLTDAVGNIVSFDQALLGHTNCFVLYVRDSDHWHRYFYFIG